MQDTCTIGFTEVAAFPNYVFSAEVVETPWENLEGFGHYGVSLAKPKVKRIGNQLHFKGTAIIPLSSDAGATLISMTAYNTYDNQPYNQVYTGTGGVNVNTEGSITFNKGASVLPAELNLCSKTIDDTYQKQYISSRQITVSGGADGASLSAVFQINISSTGTLILQTLKDIEDGAVGTGSNVGGSPLRYITSNVRSGELVPDFSRPDSRLHSFEQDYAVILNAGTGFTNGTYTAVNLLSATGSSMTATVGIAGGVVTSVNITDYGTGYATGDAITFSGTNDAGITAGTGFLGTVSGNVIAPVTTRTYLFDCDAAEPDQIGGFQFKLDGLIAYLD